MTDNQSLELFVVYERPRDYPHSYVLRRHIVTAGRNVPDPLPLCVHLASEPEALEVVRFGIPPGSVQVQRPGDDSDACILEVWI